MILVKPTYPLIIVYENQMPLIVEEGDLNKAAISVILKQQVYLSFDGKGEKWTYKLASNKVKKTFFTKLLAHTFYNPVVDVLPIWDKLGSYPVEELKNTLAYCVDQDDDILTQFVDADDLKSLIAKTSNFEQIVDVLKKYVFQVDEDELAKEFPIEE